MSQVSSVDPENVARFAAVAESWWDPAGKFAPLHALNPARLTVIREACLAQFAADAKARAPFEGRRILDVGCGGGLVCEPMRRLGFEVTGIDAAGESVDVARAHAVGAGLEIDYREVTVEALLAEGAAPFDVILALEVAEHVTDPGVFLADCARLLAPGGLLIVATLNRTVRSLALAKVAAEYILRWIPAGAHDWRKFLRPDELIGFLTVDGLEPGNVTGLVLDPLSGRWRASHDTAVNYMIAATKPAETPLP
jgi:2-polyprenyl-6-hydroxyphenyl methylase / 3-demethylubiquinone-9 3-methyltransferase